MLPAWSQDLSPGISLISITFSGLLVCRFRRIHLETLYLYYFQLSVSLDYLQIIAPVSIYILFLLFSYFVSEQQETNK